MPAKKPPGPPLQRGSACLSCRKRKLKCDGKRPICSQCVKYAREEHCEFEDKKQKSQTQKLRERLAQLEDRIRELEANPIEPSASSPSGSSEGSVPRSLGGDVQLEQFAQWTTPSAPSPSSSLSSSPLFPSTFQPLNPISRNPTPSGIAGDLAQIPFGASFSAGASTNVPLDLLGPMPTELSRLLVETFMSHRRQCWFEVDPARFTFVPHTPRTLPHPALLNAIYLLGCHFSHSSTLTELEPSFLSKSLCEITIALDASDRLIDIVHASCLLAIYFYMNARVLEGYAQAFSAARLAAGLGLHQITVFEPAPTPIPHAPPVDEEEMKDRIAVFWQVFMVDRCWSVANGLPVAMPDTDFPHARLQTPFPKPSTDSYIPEDFQMLNVLRKVYEPYSVEVTTHIPALLVKASVLYERAFRLSVSTDKSAVPWASHAHTVAALQRFIHDLPVFLGYETWRLQPPFIDVELLTVHTLARVAAIYLQREAIEVPTCEAVKFVIALIRQINALDYKFLDPMLAPCWLAVGRVFIKMIHVTSVSTGMDSFEVSAIDSEFNLVVAALGSLGTFLPLAGEYAAKLKQERDMLVT